MSIGSINYPHSNTIEKTLQKTPSLEQDRRTLQSDLKSVKNALSEVYKDLTKEQAAKKREESLLSSLVKISQNNGDNSTIRLKN
jgi:septal ring factor EnvC (AmiA/AmiB activator)